MFKRVLLMSVMFIVVSIGSGMRQANATPSICDADAGNLVANCGFEKGTYQNASSQTVPTGWTAAGDFTGGNLVFTDPPSTAPVNSGSSAFGIGNPAGDGNGGISQTIADTNNASYTLSFWYDENLSNTTANQQFEIMWNGTALQTWSGLSAMPYTEFSYSVTGSGSDTLEFLGFSQDGYNFIDDVRLDQVQGTPTGVPEPLTLSLFGAGFVGAVAMRRRKAKA